MLHCTNTMYFEIIRNTEVTGPAEYLVRELPEKITQRPKSPFA